MDNNNSIRFEHTPYHNVYLKDRKNIELTGVKNIESFDSLEFLIETSFKELVIHWFLVSLSLLFTVSSIVCFINTTNAFFDSFYRLLLVLFLGISIILVC